MELRHLRYFVAVAEELHFSRAADRVHVAQPALSRQIRDLEEELGLRLFERDRRRVALTAAGVAFLDEIKSLLGHVERAVETARRAARGEHGSLRIGYVPAVIYTALPEIVRGYRRRFPGVEVRLSEMNPAVQVEALLSDRVDVGFLRGPIQEPALAVETVLQEPLVVALPSGHALGGHKRIALVMLAGEPFVLPARSRGPGFHDQIIAICRNAGFSPRVVQEGSQIDALSLVASGAGVAIVPTSLQALRRAGVVYRPLREQRVTRLDMVWRKDATSPVLREFLQAVPRLGDRGIRARAKRPRTRALRSSWRMAIGDQRLAASAPDAKPRTRA
jgi:DNA-binding transcriptional LysR family regulator